MRIKQIRIEILLYVGILCVAAMLRFYKLAEQPVMEIEAANALRALHLSNGEHVIFDAHAGYVLFTAVFFYFFDASDFLMRFWPAFFGTLIALFPLLLRSQLGRTASVLMALGLAVDPGLIVQSRSGSSEILSLVFFLFALGFFLKGSEIFSAILTAISIISGYGVWHGVLIGLVFFVAVVIAWEWRKRRDTSFVPAIKWPFEWSWKRYLISFGATSSLLSTVFLFVPEGINGIFSGHLAYLSGWFQAFNPSFPRIAGFLAFYETLPLLLGLIAVVIWVIRRDSIDSVILTIVILSLLALFLYPGRDLSFVNWMIVPLLGLIAKKISEEYQRGEIDPIPFLAMIALIFIAFIYAGINFKALFTGGVMDSLAIQLRIAGILGAALLIPLISVLVFWGWSAETARKGLLSSVIVGLLVLNLSIVGELYAKTSIDEQEIFIDHAFVDRDIFSETVENFDFWGTTTTPPLVYLLNVQSSSLEWALIHENVASMLTLPEGVDPEMIVTKSDQRLALAETYTGQEFVLYRNPLWEELGFVDWLRWAVTRELSYTDDSLILWVRSDLFPGYEITNAE